MILIGDGERIFEFDVHERHVCEHCMQERDFRMRLKYRYGHFYALFGWVIEAQYQLVCPTCGHGWVLDRRSAEALIGGNPIPFHQRSGWWVGIVLAVVVAVAALLHDGA